MAKSGWKVYENRLFKKHPKTSAKHARKMWEWRLCESERVGKTKQVCLTTECLKRDALSHVLTACCLRDFVQFLSRPLADLGEDLHIIVANTSFFDLVPQYI